MSKKHRQTLAPRLSARPLGQAGAARLVGTLRQAGMLHARGDFAAAESLYRSVLLAQPRHFDALHMLGVIALQSGRAQAGIELIERALRLQPNHSQALANLGNGYLLIDRPDEALRRYEQVLIHDPAFVAVLHNLGNALQTRGKYDAAAELFERLVAAAPTFDYAVGNLFHSRRQGCDWRDYAQQVETILSVQQAGSRADRPFSFLSVSDSAPQQLRCARIHAAYLASQTDPALWQGERYHHDRIRVAYVSADFRDHVVARFMAPLYARHDRARFEIIGVSLAADDKSAIHSQSKRALDQYLDAAQLSERDVATWLRAQEVDIAVDLTGYTQGCRPGILARRPAPVQVSFMGFPGTLGAPWMDYIVADDFVIPDASEGSYSERVVRLPFSFQVNDPDRLVPLDGPAPSRHGCGLPETALVLCAFSNHYKLNPELFSVWMRILSQAPHSVLWLLGDSAAVRERLCREAAMRTIAPERLVFATRVPYAQHLARLALADLFLDTFPFNAGATASDALWAGVPMITRAGEAFAARMAGSLLRAAGLPELITHDGTQYQQLAMALVTEPARLRALRAKLIHNRATAPLFDGVGYCRQLEAAYQQMWQHAQRGEPPTSFRVSEQQALLSKSADVDPDRS
jgi:protein O-GlcNAc transferase